MKIAFNHQMFCLQRYGGISRYFVQIAKQLSLQEQDVKIFAPLHRNHYLGELPKNLVKGIDVKQYPPKSSGLMLSINKMISCSMIRKWKPDVLHETYYSDATLPVKNYPVVITVYDMIHELFKNNFSVNDKTIAQKKTAILRADHIICISESTRQDMLDHFKIDEKKTSVIHLGFSQFDKSNNNSPLLLDNNKPYLLYVGNRNPYKNFSTLLKAVASCDKLKSEFNIIAFGGGKLTPDEISLLEQLSYAKNQVIQINGDDNILSSLYKNASAFVYPSLYEGFGLPLLEAMGERCPVISSNTSSMPEVAGNAAVYFDPNDTEDLANAIESVVYSEQKKEYLIQQGITRLENFTWQACATKTFDIYQSLT